MQGLKLHHSDVTSKYSQTRQSLIYPSEEFCLVVGEMSLQGVYMTHNINTMQIHMQKTKEDSTILTVNGFIQDYILLFFNILQHDVAPGRC